MIKENDKVRKPAYSQQPANRTYQKPSIWWRVKEGLITVAGVLGTVVLWVFRVIVFLMVTPLLIIYFLWNMAKGALFGAISLVIGKFLIAFIIVFHYDGGDTLTTLLEADPLPTHMPPGTSHWINWWLGGTGENLQIISHWWDYAFILTFAILTAVTLTFSPHLD